MCYQIIDLIFADSGGKNHEIAVYSGVCPVHGKHGARGISLPSRGQNLLGKRGEEVSEKPQSRMAQKKRVRCSCAMGVRRKSHKLRPRENGKYIHKKSLFSAIIIIFICEVYIRDSAKFLDHLEWNSSTGKIYTDRLR